MPQIPTSFLQIVDEDDNIIANNVVRLKIYGSVTVSRIGQTAIVDVTGGGGSLIGTTAADDTFLGVGAGANDIQPTYNTFVGVNAGHNNTTGDDNAAFGDATFYSNTTGINNAAFGVNALYNNTSGYGNAAFGVGTLYNNTTGDDNAAFGTSALGSNTTGDDNAAFGPDALGSNTTGSNNAAFGEEALANNTVSSYNIALGFEALQNFVGPGGYGHDTNIAIGSAAMGSAADGGFNIGIGYRALNDVAGGSANIGLGGNVLPSISTGNYNIGIGEQVGGRIQVSDDNILIGFEVDAPDDTGSYLNIGGEILGKIGGPGIASAFGFGTGIVVTASLPAAAGKTAQRYFVSDSTVDAGAATFGATVVGGGTFNVPVWCDGTSWRIG